MKVYFAINKEMLNKCEIENPDIPITWFLYKDRFVNCLLANSFGQILDKLLSIDLNVKDHILCEAEIEDKDIIYVLQGHFKSFDYSLKTVIHKMIWLQ